MNLSTVRQNNTTTGPRMVHAEKGNEMITIKAIFENGDSLITRINATEQEAREYYIGKYFNLGTVGDDMQRCIAVEIITD